MAAAGSEHADCVRSDEDRWGLKQVQKNEKQSPSRFGEQLLPEVSKAGFLSSSK